MNFESDASAPSAVCPLTVREAVQRITEIEVLVRKLSEETGTGRHRSFFSGTGSEFQEIREYRFGDDVRAIDWNCTARFCETYLRVFTEEHDTALHLVVDRSASGTFGRERSKDEVIFEIAVSLVFSAQRWGDSTGICLFTDDIEQFIPPGKGRRHTALLLNTLMTCRPKSRRTDIGKTISRLLSKIPKRAMIVLLSDFDSGDFGEEMLLLGRRHEVRAIWVKDRSEYEIPDAGYLLVRDPETGEELVVDTSDPEFRRNFGEVSAAREAAVAGMFAGAGIRPLEIFTDENYTARLKTYFKLGGRVPE
jgi:uncharacterized protein (DUF58 family)